MKSVFPMWFFRLGLLPPTVAWAASFETPNLSPQTEFERALSEFDEAQQSRAADRDRAVALFRSAARRFEAILQSGIVNGRLEYNAGNAFLQAGDLGRAVLHYLRARRLIPRDPLLEDNLAAARKRCLTNIAPSRKSVVLRSAFFWHYQTSLRERWFAALTLYAAAWTLLSLRAFAPRRWMAVAGLVLGTASLPPLASVAFQQRQEQHAPQGVVTALDVPVHKGPGAGYQRLFEQPLQPGVEFTLRERRAGWCNAELPDGSTGWIDESGVDFVTGSSTFNLPAGG
jgi:tetratricopeptide (TPR) repeat protein